jgi:hypothetical protein
LTAAVVDKEVAAVEDAPAPCAAVWVIVSNLEAQLVTAASRALVVRLFERLTGLVGGNSAVAAIVTSTVDPIAHFEELFHEELREIHANASP